MNRRKLKYEDGWIVKEKRLARKPAKQEAKSLEKTLYEALAIAFDELRSPMEITPKGFRICRFSQWQADQIANALNLYAEIRGEELRFGKYMKVVKP